MTSTWATRAGCGASGAKAAARPQRRVGGRAAPRGIEAEPEGRMALRVEIDDEDAALAPAQARRRD